jgi:hypothetical protein
MTLVLLRTKTSPGQIIDDVMENVYAQSSFVRGSITRSGIHRAALRALGNQFFREDQNQIIQYPLEASFIAILRQNHIPLVLRKAVFFDRLARAFHNLNKEADIVDGVEALAKLLVGHLQR